MQNIYVDYTSFTDKLKNNNVNINDVSDQDNIFSNTNVADADIPVSNPTTSNPVNNPNTTPETKSFRDWLKENEELINKGKTETLKQEITNYINGLDIDSAFKSYLIRLAERESGFNPEALNDEGYMGLYQFGEDTLQDIGFTADDYKSDWKKQIDAAIKFTNLNRDRLEMIINSNVGRKWGNKQISEYGILGAAHLGGAGGVRDLLLKGWDKQDSNDTKISDYLLYFS